MAKISAHAEAEGACKLKDRLEVLLFAETLQGTLSPNANPWTGLNGGHRNRCRKPPKDSKRQLRDTVTVLDLNVYTRTRSFAQGGIRKVNRMVRTTPVSSLPVHDPALHHERHVLHDADVRERIAWHGDDIGPVPGL
jgi:hypothetical protein